MVYLPEHASLHSVSVRVALIHGFIEHDFGLKPAHLPFRNGITPLSALVSCINIQEMVAIARIFIRGLHGPAGI